MKLAELLSRWDERDDRYSRRRLRGLPHSISSVEAGAIRGYRLHEIDQLPSDDQPVAHECWRARHR
jgi:hypothetical protein